ncbi:hypothetical protein LSAT2_023182 [Lamellibrachia satsuma]|nr:hypothetical protein LSAT2_023182 [Lamellibrachia satsuma]
MHACIGINATVASSTSATITQNCPHALEVDTIMDCDRNINDAFMSIFGVSHGQHWILPRRLTVWEGHPEDNVAEAVCKEQGCGWSFLHQQWSAVMEELLYSTPCVDDDDDDGYDSPLPTEDWNAECNERAAFMDHRRKWAEVMTELARVRPLIQVNKERATTEHVAGQTRSITATIGGARQFLQTASAVAVQLKSSPEER